MNLIPDRGVPRDAATQLREIGHECKHFGEIGMCEAVDDEILALALRKHAIVVTLDADFHTILAVTGASAPSVIRVRTEGLKAPAVVEPLLIVFAEFDADLNRGALLTVKARKITCHRLPIGNSD